MEPTSIYTFRNASSVNCFKKALKTFLFNVRQKTDACYSYRLDVRLSVRPYCVKTAQPIVKMSSLPGSSFLRSKHFPGIPMGTPLTGALNARR